MVSHLQVEPRVLTEFTASSSIVSIMLSQPKTKGDFESFTPNDIIVLKREKPKHSDQKEDNPENSLQEEATVLGVS